MNALVQLFRMVSAAPVPTPPKKRFPIISQCRHDMSGAEKETNEALKEIRRIAKKHAMTMPEIALKWAFAGNEITSSLCGSRNVKELQMNIKAASEPLSSSLLKN